MEDTSTPPQDAPADPRLAQIDEILAALQKGMKEGPGGSAATAELVIRGYACLERLASPDSPYRKPFVRRPFDRSKSSEWFHVLGCLNALRADLVSGRFDVNPPRPAMQPATDGERARLPPFEAHQVRQAFVVFVAVRCTGMEVPTGAAGSRRLLGHVDPSVETYLRKGTFAEKYDELLAWAAGGDERWPRIWAAFRSDWNIPAEIKGPAEDRTEEPDPA